MFAMAPYQRILLQREVDEKRAKKRAISARRVHQFCTCGDFGHYGLSMYVINREANTIMRADPYNIILTKTFKGNELDFLTLGAIVNMLGVPKKEHISKIEYLPI